MTMTCAATLESLTVSLSNLVGAGALLVGGYWTWGRFIRTREAHSRIDVNATMFFVGHSGVQHLAVVDVAVTNAGLVRHFIHDMTFDLRCTLEGAPLAAGPAQILNQVNFPVVLYTKQRLFPESWVWSFVEPGATNHYRYAALVPDTANFALVSARVKIPGEDGFSGSWSIVPVPGIKT